MLRPSLLLAIAAAGLMLGPLHAQVDSILATPTFAEDNNAFLGAQLDLKGNFAVLSAPGTEELHFYTRNAQTEDWNGGLAIDLSAYEAIGSPVALGEDLGIYYIAVTDAEAQAWQLRRRTLGIGGGTDSTISPYSGIQIPNTIQVRGDLMILGWRPLIQQFRGSPLNQLARFEALQRINGNFVTVIQETAAAGSLVGWGVATDGTRFAVTDPSVGAHGAVRVYVQSQQGPWVLEQQIDYSNPLQPDVHFGSSVAIDGPCLLVGMEDYNVGFLTSAVADVGGAVLYGRTSTWTPLQVLSPHGALANDNFGRTSALLDRRILVGSELAQRTNNTVMGDVSLWETGTEDCATTHWHEVSRLRSLPLVFDTDALGRFGTSMVLGDTEALIGDPFGETGEQDGRGYVFDLSSQVALIFSDGFESGDTATWSLTP